MIYERTNSNGNSLPLTSLAPLAEEIGLNAENLQSFWKVEDILNEYYKTDERDVELKLQELLEIFFYIIKLGKLILSPEQNPFDELKIKIDKMLK